MSAGSVLPRPTLSRSELCEVSRVLPPPPYPLDTFSSFPFPLFREPLPSGFWEPHVPISEGELRFKILPSHIKPCVTVLWLPQSLRPSTVADTGPTLSNRGGSGRGPGGWHRFKRVAPGKQGFTKQTNPVDWAGPVWSGLQNESSTQGTASSATTGWLAWAGGWGRWPSSQHGAGPPPLLQPRPLSVLASAPPGTSPVATHPQDVRFPTGKMGIILLTSQSCC